MQTKQRKVAAAGLAALAVMVSGCSSAGKQPDTAAGLNAADIGTIGKDPITLTVYQDTTGITDEEFTMFIAEPVRKKFPQVTMKLERKPKDRTLEELVMSNEFPDMVYASSFDINKFRKLDLLLDLNDMIKKYNFPLDKFDKSAIDEVNLYGEKGQFFEMPMFMNFASLFYNKDIFDKYAVSYPKDGMLWEEVADLARKVTKTEGGQSYYGLATGGAPRLSVSFLLQTVDTKTNKAIFTQNATNSWKRYIELLKSVSDIPGNKMVMVPAFMKDRNVAMLASYGARLGEFEDFQKQGIPMNWDMVTFPSRKEAPLVVETEVHGLMVSASGKHKEEAFQVAAWLTEKSNQLEAVKYGKMSPLKDQELKTAFGANLQSLKGKNVQALFKNKQGQNPPRSLYDDIARNQLNTALKDYYENKADANTVLQRAEDATNKQIATLLK
jgi:multiple sugar transport system substrate-binding protein